MRPSRRTVLAALAAGAGTIGGPSGASAASAGAGRTAAEIARSANAQAAGEYALAWDQRYGGDFGWESRGATVTADGSLVAACNLMADEESPRATRIVEIGPENSSETIGIIGNPDHEPREYWYWDVESAIGSGYVLVGYEAQFSQFGSREDVIPKITRMLGGGSVDWNTQVEGTAQTFDLPEPVSVVRSGDQYVVASREFEGGVGTALAAYDDNGNRRWKRGYIPQRDDGVSPVQLLSTDDGVVFLGVRGVASDNYAVQPVVARLNSDGSVADRAFPLINGDRYPLGLAERDGRFLIVGTVGDGSGDASEGWAMALDGLAREPTWQGTSGDFGADLAGAVGSTLFDGWVAGGGNAGGSGQIVGGADVSAPSIARSVDSADRYEAVVTAGDGASYAVGREATGVDASLSVARVSTPLNEGEFEVTAEPGTVDPGEEVSLSVDTGDYASGLLSASWSADGTDLDADFQGTTSFQEPGDHTLRATVSTVDGRTLEVERTVTVRGEDDTDDGSDGTDDEEDSGGGGGLPGFGVLAAAAGLAGGAALWGRRDSGGTDEPE